MIKVVRDKTTKMVHGVYDVGSMDEHRWFLDDTMDEVTYKGDAPIASAIDLRPHPSEYLCTDYGQVIYAPGGTPSTPPSDLDRSKARAMRKLIEKISELRNGTDPLPDHQQAAYALKYSQAQSFKDAGYPEEDAPKFPMLANYAALSKIDHKQAADAILFKNAEYANMLMTTENDRQIYKDAIANASTEEEVMQIEDQIANLKL